MYNNKLKVGIEAISFDIPKIYLPIKSLAQERNIEVDKLEKGLGLLRMALPDAHQDVVVFAANAIKKLLEQEKTELSDIHRIYVGTESGIDSSKPIASYLISIIEQEHGEGVMEHCDAVDFNFACIGGVDAFLNSLDFVRLNPQKKAIVVCTDFAKYDFESGGEYTQGAGAVALLLGANPKMMTIDSEVGISTKGVFDFFKPRRVLSKEMVVGEKDNPVWNGIVEEELEIFKEQPIFDGQYSNECYQDRIKGAYFNLKEQLNMQFTLYQQWSNVVVHLPYSFQGRRMFSEIYALDSTHKNQLPTDKKEYAIKIKEISKTPEYKQFVEEKFSPAEKASSLVGNMYTASIFMGLLSTLYFSMKENIELGNKKIGFLGYGSGSKAKAFQGTVQPEWKEQIKKTKLFEVLEDCKPIEFSQYETLYKKEQKKSVLPPKNEYILKNVEKEKPLLLGARYYSFVE